MRSRFVLLILGAILMLLFSFQSFAQVKYGYLGPKVFISGNPDPDLSTVFAGYYNRIILAFVWPDENGNLKYYDNIRTDILPQLTQNSVDFAISLGGEGTSKGFKSLGDPSKRYSFLGELEVFATNNRIKKVDIDWEFPGPEDPEDGEILISLIIGLRNIFENISLVLPYGEYWGKAFPDTILKMADEFEIMMYMQAWAGAPQAFHINSLFGPDLSIEKSLAYWMGTRGLPAEKILIGLSYYGFIYYGADELGQPLPPNSRGDYVPNFEIERRWGHLPVQWDNERQVPYLVVGGDSLVVFDNQRSYDLKIAYAQELGLKGVFFWQIGQEVGQFDTSVDSHENSMRGSFDLYQNYPNPFNAETKIHYTIAQASHVTLVVYDVLGREVVRLIDEHQRSASYSVVWNAGDVPSGVYFYHLEAGDFVQTKRMVLLR